MHNGGAGGARDAVVVGLAQAADGADAGLGQEVHGQVGQALLRDDQVGLVPDDLRALPLHRLLLQLQQHRPDSAVHPSGHLCLMAHLFLHKKITATASSSSFSSVCSSSAALPVRWQKELACGAELQAMDAEKCT